VKNRVKANFVFENGKIVKHTDQFDFYKWAKRSPGLTDLLPGKTSFLKNKVRIEAKKNLDTYIGDR
jgi:hypothetical protein